MEDIFESFLNFAFCYAFLQNHLKEPTTTGTAHHPSVNQIFNGHENLIYEGIRASGINHLTEFPMLIQQLGKLVNISSFKSISTGAARCQDLSLNPQKLAGQCGKLKCCLNYEVATYMDAQSRIPRVSEPLEFEDGLAYLRKTDILAEVMYFSYDKTSDADLYPLDASEVREIIKMNRNGIKPESLRSEPEPASPEFVTSVGDDSISRFDAPKRKKNNSGRNRRRRQQNNNNNAK